MKKNMNIEQQVNYQIWIPFLNHIRIRLSCQVRCQVCYQVDCKVYGQVDVQVKDLIKEQMDEK